MGKENTKQKTGNAVLNALKKSNMTAMAAILVIMIIIASVVSPHFLNIYNLQSVLRDLAFIGMIGIAQSLLLLLSRAAASQNTALIQLRDPKTYAIHDEIALKQGESLLFYVNCRERYEYDQLDFSLKIGAKTYEGPLWINEKPEVSGQTQSFNKSAPADVVISADLKGYEPISIKIAGKEVGADSYVYEAGKLTIKKEFLATIGNGLKTVEISTEKGTVTCRLQISGDNSVQEQTPSNPSFPAWGIVLICVGAAVIAGGIAVFVIVRKRKNGKKQ